jgi:hypothetical protein
LTAAPATTKTPAVASLPTPPTEITLLIENPPKVLARKDVAIRVITVRCRSDTARPELTEH